MAANGEDPPPDVEPDVVFEDDDAAHDDPDADPHAPQAENVTIDGSKISVVATAGLAEHASALGWPRIGASTAARRRTT